MAEFYRFFDSTIDDIREYTADEFSEYFRMVLTNGIYNGGTNLQVVAGGSNMTVDIEDGYANIYGYLYKVLGGVTLPIETADVTYNRIDRIVIRWDKREESRFIKAMVLKGVAAEHPTPPELTRTDDIHELSLAQVLVKAGTNNISGDAVTDERLNAEVCGLINSLIQADTTEIFNQFQAWYDEKIPNFEKAFNDWYTSKIPAYEKQWSDWYANNPTVYEGQWSNWYGTNIPAYEKQWSDWFGNQQLEGFVTNMEIEGFKNEIRDVLTEEQTKVQTTLTEEQQKVQLVVEEVRGEMPFRMTDGEKTYRYGFTLNDSKTGIKFIYEEVV